MVKWEYKRVMLCPSISGKHHYIDDTELEEMGRDGWELIQIYSTWAYFKRPKQQNSQGVYDESTSDNPDYVN